MRNFIYTLLKMFKPFKNLKEFYSHFYQTKGFSLIELLTSVGIVGTLSVIGIKTYQAQTNKAKTTEAKHSLSAVFAAEKNFKEVWGAYHENLPLVGVVPEGVYNYDIGFGKSSTLSQADGNLGKHPANKDLTIRECTNFYQICAASSNCLSKAQKVKGKSFTYFFYGDPNAGTKNALTFNCRITGGLYVKDYATKVEGANASAFTAFARSKLAGDDIWSVNQEKTFDHVSDGTR